MWNPSNALSTIYYSHSALLVLSIECTLLVKLCHFRHDVYIIGWQVGSFYITKSYRMGKIKGYIVKNARLETKYSWTQLIIKDLVYTISTVLIHFSSTLLKNHCEICNNRCIRHDCCEPVTSDNRA